MAHRRLTSETAARLAAGAAMLGLALLALGARRLAGGGEVVSVHGRMSEDGGWTPDTIRAEVGRPLKLRLMSDDVVHGFGMGHSEAPPIDLDPGRPVETTLTFDQPGTYVFYCTRWCGPNHWRMRGVIEVSGPAAPLSTAEPPLYVTLGIDLDAPRTSPVMPASRPSASRGAAWFAAVPESFGSRDAYAARSPAETWLQLRRLASTDDYSDGQVWDLVAWVWRSNTSASSLAEGATLYAQNCAACHGETGQGDGVMADSVVAAIPSGVRSAMPGEGRPSGPADFTDAARMLGASPALLHGKISRGGMGTGMPYWGPILTEAQIWALTDYLWTFQFEE